MAKHELDFIDYLADVVPELASIMRYQGWRFKEKFGRLPEPGEPIFFNPDASTPEYLSDAQVFEQQRSVRAAMGKAHFNPKGFHEFTNGVFLTEEDWGKLSEGEKDAYNEVLFHYRRHLDGTDEFAAQLSLLVDSKLDTMHLLHISEVLAQCGLEISSAVFEGDEVAWRKFWRKVVKNATMRPAPSLKVFETHPTIQ